MYVCGGVRDICYFFFLLFFLVFFFSFFLFFFQAEDGIRDLVRSRGLGDVYKRQPIVDGLHEFGMIQFLPQSNEIVH